MTPSHAEIILPQPRAVIEALFGFVGTVDRMVQGHELPDAHVVRRRLDAIHPFADPGRRVEARVARCIYDLVDRPEVVHRVRIAAPVIRAAWREIVGRVETAATYAGMFNLGRSLGDAALTSRGWTGLLGLVGGDEAELQRRVFAVRGPDADAYTLHL